MIFFPYKAEKIHSSIPLVTFAICIICAIVFQVQLNSRDKINLRIYGFCNTEMGRMQLLAFKKAGLGTSAEHCADLMWEMRQAQDLAKFVEDIASKSKKFPGISVAQSNDYIVEQIMDRYDRFNYAVPLLFGNQYAYASDSWDPLTMVTNVFLHADIYHLLGNLIFFFAFAATVELILGTFFYILVILWLAIGTNLFYSLYMISFAEPAATIGLSGVVMGTMGLFSYFLPQAKIRCFIWFIIFFKRFSVPAWILTLGYFGLDVISLFTDDGQSNINFIAHVSGGAIGYLTGIAFFRGKKSALLECL